jgi:hypothetical protein
MAKFMYTISNIKNLNALKKLERKNSCLMINQYPKIDLHDVDVYFH